MDFLVKSTYEKNMKERNFTMKKFRKLIVAVMAMALALGMLTMSASAADTKYYVVGNMQGWDKDNGIEMTDAGNGIYTYTFEVADTNVVEFKILTAPDWETQISIGGGNNGGNITYTPDAAGKLTITLDSAKIGPNNEADDAVTVAPAVPTTGDATPVAVVAVIALVAAAGVVVCAKRRAVTE